MRRTKEEAEATRKALLTAALTVFSERGYADTRLEEIAERAGVTRGAIYHHFGSKAELFNVLMAEITERLTPIIGQSVEEGGTNLDIFRRIIIRNLDYLEKDAEYRAAIELANIRTGVPPELEDGMRLKVEAMQDTIAEITGYFQHAIDCGEVNPEIDPQAAAIVFFSLQNAVGNMWLMLDQSFSLNDIASKMADIFIRGIKKS